MNVDSFVEKNKQKIRPHK